MMLCNLWMALSISWYSSHVSDAAFQLSAFGVAVRSAFAALVIYVAGGFANSRHSLKNGGFRFHFAWTSLAAANLCFLFAFLSAKPGRTMFLATLYPMMTLFFEWAEKRPTRKEVASSLFLLALAIFGLALILLDDFRLDFSLGDVLAISSAFLFAVYMITAKRLPEEERDCAAGVGFFGDVIFSLIVAAVLSQVPMSGEEARKTVLPAIGWLSVVVFGVLSGAEFLVINRAFKTLKSSEVSMLHLAQPVLVAGIEVVFLTMSRPGVYFGGACVLIAAGARAYLAEKAEETPRT